MPAQMYFLKIYVELMESKYLIQLKSSNNECISVVKIRNTPWPSYCPLCVSYHVTCICSIQQLRCFSKMRSDISNTCTFRYRGVVKVGGSSDPPPPPFFGGQILSISYIKC